MELKPIRTKADYEAALKNVAFLLDAPVGSLEAEMLDRLSSLVEEYEEEHYPIGPADPIEAVKFRKEQMGASARKFTPTIVDVL
jgi:HTH-type transcriptional regulator/antitoxin HigA